MSQSKNLFPRKVVVVLFYDNKLNIFVENRRKNSKVGEKYGFFGGGVENGETTKEALLRELSEELDYTPEKLTHFGKYSFTLNLPESDFHGEKRYGELYFSPITKDLKNSKNFTKGTLLSLDRILENRFDEFGPVEFNDTENIKLFLIKLANKFKN